MLRYEDLPSASKCVDKKKPISVRLSRYQAWLFKTKLIMMASNERQGFLLDALSTLQFLMVQLLVLTTCPKVLFLADFYDLDGVVLRRVQFVDTESGTTVTFLPKSWTDSSNQ